MARMCDLKGKQASWKRLEYKHVSSLSISIRFDHDKLEESSVRTSNVDDGHETFKIGYDEMQWIEKQIDAALEMNARSVRLSLMIIDEKIEKRCSIRS